MKNTLHKVVLLRHAESIKNVKKIHGGHGETLTDNGKVQAIEVAEILANSLNIETLKIFSSTSFHTRATAEIIAHQLNKGVENPLEFSPLHLGVADGLSEQELRLRYPDVQALFERWRRREFDIKKLVVSQMEPYMDFWNRGMDFLSQLPQNCDIVLVCSNSLMILLAHIMLNHHPERTNKYKHLDIHNCGMVVFDRNGDEYQLNIDLTSVNVNQLQN